MYSYNIDMMSSWIHRESTRNTRQFPVPIFFGVSMIWFSGHVRLHRKIFIQASIILGRHLPHWWIHWSNLEEWCCSSLAFPKQVFSWALWLVDWLTKDSAHLPKEWPLETHVIFFWAGDLWITPFLFSLSARHHQLSLFFVCMWIPPLPSQKKTSNVFI